MTAERLVVFALNGVDPGQHTSLTRAEGAVVALPPLAAWLGVRALDTDAVEMFPVSDLGAMRLSDYIAEAYTPDAPLPRPLAGKLDALEGSVLLVPDTAFTGRPDPGPEVTRIGAVRLAQPDHAAELPRVPVRQAPRDMAWDEDADDGAETAPPRTWRKAAIYGVVIVMAALMLIKRLSGSG